MLTSVNSLDENALVDILTQPKNALVKQYKKFFEFDGVELEFTDDAMRAISEQAIQRHRAPAVCGRSWRRSCST